jgi:hypothetical protein
MPVLYALIDLVLRMPNVLSGLESQVPTRSIPRPLVEVIVPVFLMPPRKLATSIRTPLNLESIEPLLVKAPWNVVPFRTIPLSMAAVIDPLLVIFPVNVEAER